MAKRSDQPPSKRPKVRLYLRVPLPDGSRRYLDPVWAANGKLKPHWAMVGGVPEHHPEAGYHLRHTKNGKSAWVSAGRDPQSALAAKRRLEAETAAAEPSGPVPSAPAPNAESGSGSGRDFDLALAEFLDETRAHRSEKTFAAYSCSLRKFRECCGADTLEEVSRKHVLGFKTFLEDGGSSPRIIANRIANVKTFLIRFDVKLPTLKTDKFRYVEKAVSAYSRSELHALLRAARLDQRELFHFLLGTGARDQETQTAAWSDLDFERRTFTVREKRHGAVKFTPKDKEERIVPIPQSLADMLRARRARHPLSRLVFPGPLGKPNRHFLRELKRLALNAGLNCGNCYNKKVHCCADKPVCARYILHRFRKNFATAHHENGISARTLQKWLGHSDLETTLRYLASGDDESEQTRAAVDSTFAAYASI
jgi:integrase